MSNDVIGGPPLDPEPIKKGVPEEEAGPKKPEIIDIPDEVAEALPTFVKAVDEATVEPQVDAAVPVPAAETEVSEPVEAQQVDSPPEFVFDPQSDKELLNVLSRVGPNNFTPRTQELVNLYRDYSGDTTQATDWLVKKYPNNQEEVRTEIVNNLNDLLKRDDLEARAKEHLRRMLQHVESVQVKAAVSQAGDTGEPAAEPVVETTGEPAPEADTAEPAGDAAGDTGEPAGDTAEPPADKAAADKAAADKAAADKAAADKAAADKAAADKAAADKAAADKAAADKAAADKAAADKAAADKAAADKAAADKAAADKAAADKAAADKAAADKAAAEKESADKAATVNNLIQEFMASDKAMVGFLRSIDQRVSRGELTPEVALLVKQEINGRVGDFVSNLSEQITNGSLTVDQARQYVQSLNNPILRDRANELLKRIDRKNISIDGANIEEMLESLMNTPDFQNAPPAVQQLLRNQAESMAAENATRRQHSQELGEIATAMRTLEGPAGDMRERFEGQFYRGRLAMPALIFILVTAGAFLIPGMNAVIGPIMLVNLLGTGGMALRNIFRNGGLDEYLRQRMDQALARYRTIEQIEGDADTQHTTAEARDREILNQLIRQTTLLLASGTPGDPAQREAVANFLANSLGVNVILPTGSK